MHIEFMFYMKLCERRHSRLATHGARPDRLRLGPVGKPPRVASTDRRRGLSSTPALLLGANDAATRLADRNDHPGARRGGDAGRIQGSRVGAALARRYIAGATPEAALTRAARLNDEVGEVAELGPMRLFLCDLALERARLAFARLEAFAPLNGLVDDSPPKPGLANDAEAARLTRKRGPTSPRRASSSPIAATTGATKSWPSWRTSPPHRRFADLPPRV